MHILLADDHEMFLSGLQLALQDLGTDISFDLARDYRELISFVFTDTKYDLILTDLAMPGMNWIDAITEIKQKMPQTPVVILSAVHSKDIIDKALELKVNGFIPKTSSNKIIINVIQKVLAGGIYIPPEISISNEEFENDILDNQGSTKTNPNLEETSLTPRQKEILTLIGQGKSNKIIAHELGLSEGTVKLHVTSILKALKVSNRTGAIMTAISMGLVKPENIEK
ncbi:MAG: response regulator [Alphaproteobacteria bacterium]